MRVWNFRNAVGERNVVFDRTVSTPFVWMTQCGSSQMAPIFQTSFWRSVTLEMWSSSVEQVFLSLRDCQRLRG